MCQCRGCSIDLLGGVVHVRRQPNAASPHRGFDAGAVSRSQARGLGLVSMRERAQIIGGTLDIESSPGGGTTIYLHLPITESRDHPFSKST